MNNPMGGGQMDVPNATVALVLGICSIVICVLGPILGIIGLVLSGSGKKAYESNPGLYKESSYKNLKAGRICSIIGICVGALYWIWWIVWVVIIGAAAVSSSVWN
jgi:hypothetical protein